VVRMEPKRDKNNNFYIKRWRLNFNDAHPHLLVNLFFSWAYFTAVLIAFCIHFSTEAGVYERHLDAAAGAAAFFAWLRCINYLRITRRFGPFVISVGLCVHDFIVEWVPVAFFCGMAFMCVLAALLDPGFEAWPDFFLLLFSAAIGEPDFETLTSNSEYHDTATTILYGLYTLLMSLLLINLLIAMMSESFAGVQEKVKEKAALARGRGVLAFTLLRGPREILRICGCGACATEGRKRPPHHVQVFMEGKMRGMMMLEELYEPKSNMNDSKAAKNRLLRMEKNQRHLGKKMDTVEKKLDQLTLLLEKKR